MDVTWADALSAWSAVGTGVVTLAAFGAAAWAAFAASRTVGKQDEQVRLQAEQLQQQANQLRQLEDDRRTELASRFGVWLEERSASRFAVMYHNSSPQPMYDVKLLLNYRDEPQKGVQMFTVPPTVEPCYHRDATEALSRLLNLPLKSANGLDDQLIAVDGDPDWQLRRLSMMSDTNLRVVFMDANGVVWRRNSGGKLERRSH